MFRSAVERSSSSMPSIRLVSSSITFSKRAFGRPPLAQQHDEEDERERDEDATEDGPAKGVAHGSTPDLVRFALTIPLSGRRFA